MPDLIRAPKHEDLIYDVGLHKGEDSEFYLKKGFRVVAFEADPDLVRACRQRLAEFIAQGRLTIIEGAIVDPETLSGETTIRFYKNDDTSVWGTVRGTWAERNARLGTQSRTIEVPAVDFVSVLREHGVPHYMKIDIEGCDMVCVEALGHFADKPDYLSLESDKTSVANVANEIATLVELGYESFQAVEQSAIPVSQVPPQPPREGTFVPHRFEDGASGLFGAELSGPWKSREEILRQYRMIGLGYYLVGDDGVVSRWTFRGASRLQSLIKRVLGRFTQAAVPGWYDTHARHTSVGRLNNE